MAKRNCRRTNNERCIHERAVALRKMTDEQLIEHLDRQFTAGVDAGRMVPEVSERETAEKILTAIAGIKGIGAATAAKIRAATNDMTGGEPR
jgi:1-deoxy-D-xylulose 5-phosphate reductoisomerase